MALLNFKYGMQNNLPAYNAAEVGTVYVTTDSNRMFIALPDRSDYVGLGDFHLVSYSSGTAIDALGNLPTNIKRQNILYLTVNASGATAMYRYDGSKFVAISNTAEIADIKTDIQNLTNKVALLETFKDTTVPATYMPIAGGEFTGDVSFKAGEYLTVNTPTADGHAATKAYADSVASAAQEEAGKYTDARETAILGKTDDGKNFSGTVKGAYEAAESAASAAAGALGEAEKRVAKAGDEMTGFLKLHADPTDAMHAATKQYVDALKGTSSDTKDSATIEGAKKHADSAVAAAKTAILGQTDGKDFDGTVQGAYSEAAGANSAAAGALAEAQKKAPIAHASSATTYGVGSDTLYGHVKLSDSASNSAVASGIAATPKAVQDAAAQVVGTDTDTKDSATVKGAKKYTDAAKTAVLGTNEDGSDFNGTVKEAYNKIDNVSSLAQNIKDTAEKAMPKSGGQFSGDITFGDGANLTVHTPDADGHAANKKYVDDQKTAVSNELKGNKSTDTKDSETIAGAKLYTDDQISDVNTTIANLKADIGNLSNIMNFLGATGSEISDGSTTNPVTIGDKSVTAVAGDVVVSGNKEFVFDGSKWAEIGDVSAESGAISGLLDRMDAAEGNISGLREDVGTDDGKGNLFARVSQLEQWDSDHNTAYTNLEGRVAENERDIKALEDTVGTRPATPTMDNTLWEEVADLRTDLGEKSDTTGDSAFARIYATETAIGSEDAANSILGRVKKLEKYDSDLDTKWASVIGTPETDLTKAGKADGTLSERIQYNYHTNDNILELLTWGSFDPSSN